MDKLAAPAATLLETIGDILSEQWESSPPAPPLESYPAAVLAEFIRRRGLSYFPEELEAAAAAVAGSTPAARGGGGRCARCAGFGIVGFPAAGPYCTCPMGQDLGRVAASDQRRQARENKEAKDLYAKV